MQGYEEEGVAIAPITTIDGMFAKARASMGEPDFMLPVSWSEKEGALRGDCPFNFISTHDIIGSTGLCL